MNLPDLIDISKKSKRVEKLLNKAVKNIFGDRKPLTEILDKLQNNTKDNGDGT